MNGCPSEGSRGWAGTGLSLQNPGLGPEREGRIREAQSHNCVNRCGLVQATFEAGRCWRRHGNDRAQLHIQLCAGPNAATKLPAGSTAGIVLQHERFGVDLVIAAVLHTEFASDQGSGDYRRLLDLVSGAVVRCRGYQDKCKVRGDGAGLISG